MFLASPWLEKYRFSNQSFCYFEQFKVDIYFINLGQVKIHPIWSFLLTLVTVILLCLGKMLQKTTQTFSIW